MRTCADGVTALGRPEAQYSSKVGMLAAHAREFSVYPGPVNFIPPARGAHTHTPVRRVCGFLGVGSSNDVSSLRFVRVYGTVLGIPASFCAAPA